MRTLILIIVALQFSSCRRTYELDDSDLELIPYIGNEILVFRSSLNDMDTIFLTGFIDIDGYPDPLDIFPDIYKIRSLSAIRTDPNYDRYLTEEILVSLSPSKDATFINFDIAMKRSWFYNPGSYSIEQLDSIPNSTLNINSRTYTDVKIFNAPEYAQQFNKGTIMLTAFIGVYQKVFSD